MTSGAARRIQSATAIKASGGIVPKKSFNLLACSVHSRQTRIVEYILELMSRWTKLRTTKGKTYRIRTMLLITIFLQWTFTNPLGCSKREGRGIKPQFYIPVWF